MTKTKTRSKTNLLASAAPAARAVPPPPTLPTLLGVDDLETYYGIRYHRTHLFRLVRQGRFPAPVALGPQRHARRAWRASDVQRWLDSLQPVKQEA